MSTPSNSPRNGSGSSVAACLGLVLLATVLSQVLGGASPPATVAQASEPEFTFDHWPPDKAAARGRVVYESRCIGCHGDGGQGDGAAAVWLDPLPRDFQAGNFKFRSTPSGELPTEEDLMHVVTCGLQGSSMPGFPLMAEHHRRDVVAYVLYLATFGMLKSEVDDMLSDGDPLDEVLEELPELAEEIMYDAFEDVWPVTVEQPDEFDEDMVEEGLALYEAQCVACHGATGRGDGPSSFTLRDWKDAQVVPRDFTTGVFRAGSTPRDIFLRMKAGVNGTPMPSVYGSDEDLWAITAYILSLQDEASRVAPHPTSCDAHASDG
jgi:mono/diheme cytochrome c family protein